MKINRILIVSLFCLGITESAQVIGGPTVENNAHETKQVDRQSHDQTGKSGIPGALPTGAIVAVAAENAHSPALVVAHANHSVAEAKAKATDITLVSGDGTSAVSDADATATSAASLTESPGSDAAQVASHTQTMTEKVDKILEGQTIVADEAQQKLQNLILQTKTPEELQALETAIKNKSSKSDDTASLIKIIKAKQTVDKVLPDALSHSASELDGYTTTLKDLITQNSDNPQLQQYAREKYIDVLSRRLNTDEPIPTDQLTAHFANLVDQKNPSDGVKNLQNLLDGLHKSSPGTKQYSLLIREQQVTTLKALSSKQFETFRAARDTTNPSVLNIASTFKDYTVTTFTTLWKQGNLTKKQVTATVRSLFKESGTDVSTAESNAIVDNGLTTMGIGKVPNWIAKIATLISRAAAKAWKGEGKDRTNDASNPVGVADGSLPTGSSNSSSSSASAADAANNASFVSSGGSSAGSDNSVSSTGTDVNSSGSERSFVGSDSSVVSDVVNSAASSKSTGSTPKNENGKKALNPSSKKITLGTSQTLEQFLTTKSNKMKNDDIRIVDNISYKYTTTPTVDGKYWQAVTA